MPATFVQSGWSGDGGEDPASLTLGASPTEGNLGFAVLTERSGGSADDHVMSGWTNILRRTTEQANASFRRSMSLWYKVFGAGESATISADNGTTNNKWLSVDEYALSGGGTSFTLLASVSNDNGATSNATSINTGTTGSVGGAGDYLSIAVAIRRNGTVSIDPTVYTVDNGLAVDITNGDTAGGSDGDMMHVIASDGDDTDTGTYTGTFTYSSGESANSGLSAAMVVFGLQEGGGGETVEGSVSETINFSGSQLNTAALLAAISESLQFSDQVSITAQLLSEITESLQFSDAITSLVAITGSVTEGLAFTVSQTNIADLLAFIAESVVFNDAQSNTANLLGSVSETFTFSDVQNTGTVIAAAIEESLTLSDDETIILVINAAISEGLTFNEDPTIQAALVAAIQEGLALDDQLTKQSVLLASIIETLNLSDLQAAVIDGEIILIEGRDLVVIKSFDTVVKIQWNGEKLIVIQG